METWQKMVSDTSPLRFVNGRPAAREQLVRYPIYTSAEADLHTSTLGLRFTVTEDHFPRGGGGGGGGGGNGRAMKLGWDSALL